ncbi:MAG: HPr(Ser) kinase/phosphatase, partial [Clostridia bacterium]|nr:HPr(Ser) kinase/phosphatase [Clostridia bacterium]
MEEEYSVSLSQIIKELGLESVYLPTSPENIMITNKHVNRLGLPLVGFFSHFEHTRIELMGNAEYMYLGQLSPEVRQERTENIFRHHPACIVLSSGLELFDGMKELAETYQIPILSTKENTSDFMAALIAFLNVALAPRMTRHGVLVEVYGEGVLLLGNSGIGKSETAIELVKRGHRLVADDAVEIRRVSSKTLVGQAPEIIRHYVELRGIGVVDVRRLFGMGAVSTTAKIDFVANVEKWQYG